MKTDTPITDAATHDDWSGGAAAVEVETAQEMERIARSLMRTCYDEANRLANHGSNGLEKLVMSQLYDAANAAKAKLSCPTNHGHLRHPQLLDPPSRCPRCGRKAWERVTPDDVEPRYQCCSCRWPNKEITDA